MLKIPTYKNLLVKNLTARYIYHFYVSEIHSYDEEIDCHV